MTSNRRRRPLRALALHTALGTSLAISASSALAQVAPGTVPIGPGSNHPDTTFQTVDNTGGGRTLTIDLHNRPSTIINWRAFDIAADSRANFVSTDGRTPNLVDQFSVLSRINSGNPTQIFGQLTSQPNIAVFLLNGSGIIFGATSAVSTGGFVASTLDVRDRDFTNGAFHFETGRQPTVTALFPGGGPITVEGGASIASIGKAGQLRGVVLVSPTITSNGAIDGGKGDVAFVSAADVTLSYTPGSPLGIAIARGLPVQASQVIGGTVNGQSVYFALATQAEATASLLQIDGDVRAVGTGNGVVIVGGSSDALTPGVTFTRGAQGAVGVTASAGSSLASKTDITLATRGDATLSGTARANGDFAATIAGNARITGDTLAKSGDLRITASSIEATRLRAGGSMRLEATKANLLLGSGQAGTTAELIAGSSVDVGTLRGGGAATLTAGLDVTAGLVATTDGAISVTATGGSLNGGSSDAGAVLTAGGAGSGVSVDAGQSVNVDRATGAGNATITAGSGSIVARRILGDDVTLSAVGGDVSLGTATATSAMTIGAGGAVGATGPLTAGTDLGITAGGGVSLGELTATEGRLRVTGASVDLSSFESGADATVRATFGDMTIGGDGRSGGSILLAATGDGSTGGTIGVSGALVARNGVSVKAFGDLILADVTARTGDAFISGATVSLTDVTAGGQLRGQATGALTATGLLDAGGDLRVTAQTVDIDAARADGALTLRATDGDLSLGSGSSGADMSLTASGAVDVGASLASGGDLIVGAGGAATLQDITAANGAIRVTGASVDLTQALSGDAFVLRAASGDVTSGPLTAGGSMLIDAASGAVGVTGGATARDDLTITAGGAVTTPLALARNGDLSITGASIDLTTARTGGSLTLTATSGGLTLGDATAGTSARFEAAGDLTATGDLRAGTTLSATAGGAFTARRSVTQTGDLSITAASIDLGLASAGGALSLTALRTDLTLGEGVAGGDATLSAAGALTVTGPLGAGGAVTATAGGDARLATVEAQGGDLSISGTNVRFDTATGAGAMTLTATDGDLLFDAATAGGAADLTATGRITATGSVAATSDVTVDAGAGARFADLSSADGRITVGAQAINIDTASAGTSLSLDAREGNLLLGTGQAGTFATLSATGNVTVSGAITAGTDLTVTAGGFARLGDTIATSGDLSIQARAIDLTQATAGGGLTLDATAGGLTLTSGTAGGDASLTAARAITVDGPLSAGGSATITAGGAATLGDVAATTGNLVASGITLSLGNANVGGAMTLQATRGPLSMTSATVGTSASLSATGDISVTGPLVAGIDVLIASGGSATLGDVTATAGNLSATADTLTMGAATAGGTIDLVTRQGALTLASGSSGASTTLTADGDIEVTGALTAGSALTVTSGGAVTLADATATTGDLRVRGQGITADSAVAGNTLRLQAINGDLTLGSGSAGASATLRASGNIGVAGLISAGDDLRFFAGGTVTVGDAVASSGDLLIRAVAIDLDRATSGGRLELSATQGDIALGRGSAGTTATLAAAGDIDLTNRLASGGDATFTAGGAARLGTVTATAGAVAISATDVTSGPITARGAVRVFATDGDVALRSVTAGGLVDLTASGAVRVRTIDADGGATISAGDIARINRAAAAGDLRIDAADISVDTAIAGRALALNASAGDVSLGTGTAGGSATLGATGDILVSSSLTSGGGVTITAGGDARLGSILATNGALSVLARTGSVSGLRGADAILETQGRGNAVDVSATGRAAIGRLTASGDGTVTAGAVSVASATAGGALMLTSITTGITLGTGSAGTIARLDSAADVAIRDELTTNGTAIVFTTGDARIRSIVATGGVIDVAAGGEVTGAGAGRADLVATGSDPSAGPYGVTVTTGAGRQALLGAVSADGDITVNAGTIDVLTATAGATRATGSLAFTADTGGIALDTGAATGTALLTAPDTITIGTLTADRGMTITSDAAVTTGVLTSARAAIEVTGQGLTIDRADAGTSLTLSALASDLSLGNATAGSTASLLGVDIAIGNALVSGRTTSITASGNLTATRIETNGGVLDIFARGDVLGNDASGVLLHAGGAGGLKVFAEGSVRAQEAIAFAGDVSIRAGGSAQIDTVSATGDAAVSVSGNGAATIGRMTALGDADIRAGTITADRILARDGDVRLEARGGTLDVGSVEAGQFATLSARGDLSAGSARAGGSLSLTSAQGDIALGAGRSTTGGILVSARNGAVTGQGADGALLLAGGSDGIEVRARDAATLGDVRSQGTVRIATTSGSITAGDLVSRAGSVLIRATGGSLSFGDGLAAQDIRLTATNDITANRLSAGGDVAVDAGGVVTIGRIDATDGSLRLTAASLDLGRASAARALALTTTLGDLTLGTGRAGGRASLTAADDLTVSDRLVAGRTAAMLAGGNASVADAVSSDGDVTITAATIDLDRVVAGRALSLTSTRGDLTLGTGRAGTTAALASIADLTVTQALTSGATSTLDGEGDMALGRITAQNGAIALTAGGAIAGSTGEDAAILTASGVGRNGQPFDVSVSAGGAARFGSVTADGDVSVVAEAITAGTIVAGSRSSGSILTRGSVTLDASSGGIAFDAASATGDATLTAAGPILIRRLTAEGSTLAAGQLIRAGTVAASNGTLTLRSTAGGIDLGVGIAGGDALLDALGSVTVSQRLTSGGSATVTSRAPASVAKLKAVSAGGDVDVSAGTIDIRSVDAGRALRLTASDTAGFIRVVAGTVGTTARLEGAGVVGVDTLTSGGDTVIHASDRTLSTLGSIDAGGDLTVTAGSVDATTLNADGALSVTGYDATGFVRLGTVTAETGATVFGANTVALTKSLTSGGDATISAGGPTDFGTIAMLASVTAGDDLTVSAGSISATTLAATGALTLTGSSPTGTIMLGTGSAGDAATIGGAGAVTVSTSLTSTEGTTITAGGLASLAQVDAGAGLIVDSGSIDAGTLGSTAAMALTGRDPTGAIRVGTANAGTAATITGAGSVEITTSLTSGGDASIATGDTALAALANVDASGDLTITGGSIEAGALGSTGAMALTGLDAAGAVRIGTAEAGTTATVTGAGAVDVTTSLTSGGDAVVTGSGASTASLADVTSRGTLAVTAGSITLGTANATGALTLTGRDVAGAIQIGSATAGTTATVTGAGSVAVTDQLTSGGDTTVTAGTASPATFGSIVSKGDVSITAGAIDAGTIRADGALSLTGLDPAGVVRLGTAVAGTSATVSGAGAVTVSSNLVSGGPATITANGLATFEIVGASGDVTIEAGSIDAGTVNILGSMSLVARDVAGFVTLDLGLAGTTARIAAGGNVTIGTLGTGASTVPGGPATVSIAGGGAVRIGSFDALGDATITAGTLDLLGPVTVRDSLAIAARDVNLPGSITVSAGGSSTSDPLLTFTNTGPTAGMALGDDAGAAGFTLTNAEIARIAAPALVFDGGAGGIQLGAITLGSDTASRSLAVKTTGDVTVTGALTAPASDRTVGITGSGIKVLATVSNGVTAGGRLNLDGATLTLDADRIAVGQAAGFADVLFGGLSPQDIANRFVSNSRSSLYNAALGGVAYADIPTLVRAGSMTVRYSQFALFQNTGPAVTGAGTIGTQAGVVLSGAASGPTLTLSSSGAAGPNAFSMFGTIAGVGGASAAVVGEQILSTQVDGVSQITIQNSRVNGCIIGTGGGCLTTPIGIPPTNIFDPSRLDIFVPADFEIAFDPVVGSNNESLFAGIAAIDVPTDEADLQFDPNIGGNNEALFTGDQGGNEPSTCPDDKTGKTDKPCPPKEDRR